MHFRTVRLVGLISTALATVIVAAGAASTALAAALKPVGYAAKIPAAAKVLGALAPSTAMRVTVALQSQDPAGLQAFATAVSTPGDPQFRHYISVAQFAAQYGATPAAISAVESNLQAAGLQIYAVPQNNLTIEMTGTAADLQRAFGVNLEQLRMPGGRVAFANLQAPTLPANVAGYVQGVIGLNNMYPQQPAGYVRVRHPSRRTHLRLLGSSSRLALGAPGAQLGGLSQAIGNGPQPCSSATALQNKAYTTDELSSMYGFNPLYAAGDFGQGQTIAIVEEGATQQSDIGTYDACYTGVPFGSVTYVQVGQGVGPYGPGGGPLDGDDGEQALDIEIAQSLAPRANIIVYQEEGTVSTAASDILSAIVSQNIAKVISSSWGSCEAAPFTDQTVISLENTLLQEAAAQGQSFFGSSGDSGAQMCFQRSFADPNPNLGLSVIDPGAQPFATGVGGTTLGTVSNNNFVLPTNGNYPGEFVWNDGLVDLGPGGQGQCTLFGGECFKGSATGGGVSSKWPMPSYQSNAAGSLGVINSSSSRTCGNAFCRQVPDISADASPNSGYIVFSNGGQQGGGWGTVGGTSASAPLWAAFTALTNASAACRGSVVGFVNPALYQIAGSAYLSNFHDITQGSPFGGNGSGQTASNNDIFFGVQGDPDTNSLYPVTNGYDMTTGLGSMVGSTLAASLCSLASPVFSVSVGGIGTQTTGVGLPATPVQVSASDSGGLGLALSASGLPPGLGMSPGGLISGTPTTVGSFTVTVSAADKFTNAGSTTFTWVVAAPKPPVGHSRLKGNKLTFSVQLGAFAQAFNAIKISLPKGFKYPPKLKGLKVGVNVGGVHFVAKARNGTLVIFFSSPVSAVQVTIGNLIISTHQRRVCFVTTVAPSGQTEQIRVAI